MNDYLNVMPEGLAEAGAALWAKFVPCFTFEQREEAVLVLACHQADDIATLEAVLAEEGAIVDGSRGQRRVNGALAELRQARLAQNRLLGSLKLPENEQKPMDARSRRAQHAANARWSRTAEVRAQRKGEAV